MDSAAISASEGYFITTGAEDGIRNDGRGALDYRPIHVESGVLPLANGSARVRIGEDETDVLVSVKADLITEDSIEESLRNRLNFFVDFSAIASPEFAGRGGNDLGEDLANVFYSAYDNDEVLPELNKNCIISPSHMWSIYVYVVVLKCGGNVVYTSSLGIKAALANTEVCEVVSFPADADKVMIDLPEEVKTWNFDISRAPLVIAVNRIGHAEVIDADIMEETSSIACLLVGVSPGSAQLDNADEQRMEEDDARSSDDLPHPAKVTCTKKVGGGSLELQSVQSMIDTALLVGVELDRALTQWLDEETAARPEEDGQVPESSRTFLR